MKVMIAVTHLLGTGHLRRAMTLAHAFTLGGHKVILVSGGTPLHDVAAKGVELLQLPPLQSDGVNFTKLLDENGHPASDDVFANRRALLRQAVSSLAPDVLITELFPFGRRVLSVEFHALLDAAKALPVPPIVLSSVRDILAPPSKQAKAEQTDDVIGQYYDAVLVHSDPNSTRLDQSWPVSDALAPLLRYTGYVAPPPAEPHPEKAGEGEILVSAGGGSVGMKLYQSAIEAARLMPEQQWRVLVGGKDAADRIAVLQRQVSSSNIVIEPARPDFRQMLRHADASLSLCGYNTALDILQSGISAVFVPFDDGNEVEQTLRAGSLSHLSGIAMLSTAEASPERICDVLARVTGDAKRDTTELKFDGAAQSVAIAVELAKARA